MQARSRLGGRYSQFHTLTLVMLVLFASIPAFSARHELENPLRNKYEKKTLILRHFYVGSKLHFDKEGKLLGDARWGNCTSDSTIYVSRLTIDKDNVLTLKGKRVLNLFDDNTGHFSNLVTKEAIQVEVELDSNWQDASQVQTLLDAIVTTDIQQAATDIPKYWQCWMYGNVERSSVGKWKCSDQDHPANQSLGRSVDAGRAAGDTPRYSMKNGKRVFYVGGSVTSPSKIHSPAPKYTDLAKEMHIQGTTVLDVIISERGEPLVIGPATARRRAGRQRDRNVADLAIQPRNLQRRTCSRSRRYRNQVCTVLGLALLTSQGVDESSDSTRGLILSQPLQTLSPAQTSS